jgi:predicted nucleic acid-binding protein
VPHIFVETNWLFAYAAPAHHQVPEAADLLERARRGEFTLCLPNICIGEARQAIANKCKPKHEADALRRFLAWATPTGAVSQNDAATTRVVLDKFESSLKTDLASLDDSFRALSREKCVRVFGLDDSMLDHATALALEGIAPKPFDHAILASVLVFATQLWKRGERQLSFCETDRDLQPWDKYGNPKPPLQEAYNAAHLWV